jgi:hypothetical protein
MSCCGQRREANKAWLQPHPIRLRFLGTGTFAFRGPVTGRNYSASESGREIDVDPRDARDAVQSGSFAVVR